MNKHSRSLLVLVFLCSVQVHSAIDADASISNYSAGGAQIAQQGCVEKQKDIYSVSEKAVEQKRLALKRNDLEVTARELMNNLATKESTFRKNEYSITSWFENTDDTNIAKAVINELRGQDLNISTNDACEGGAVKPGKTVPWKSFCNLDSAGDYSTAARFWTGTYVHREDGSLNPEMCGTIVFVKSGRNQSDLQFYSLDTYTTTPGTTKTETMRVNLCRDGVKYYAQSLIEFENALNEFEIVKSELIGVHHKLEELERSEVYLEDDNGCEIGSPQESDAS